MLDRIIGVITLKAPTYREIADDKTATGQAAIVVIVTLIIAGFFRSVVVVSGEGTVSASIVAGIIGTIVGLVVGLVGWVVTAWILAFVAKQLGGKTDTGEMLRVTGFVNVFDLVGVLNILTLISLALGCITGLIGFVVVILKIIGWVIGVREAAEFTTTNAIVTSVIAGVINFIIIVVIGGALLAAIVIAGGLAGGALGQ